MANTLLKTLPFKQAKGEWKVSITLGERVVHVTHRRKEESSPEAEVYILTSPIFALMRQLR